jgi:hypothetical protein
MAYLNVASLSRCIARTSTFYQSTLGLSATGNTGVIATPLVVDGGLAILPLYFYALGTNMATDETNTLTIDWFPDAAGTTGLGTTTFDQLTAGSPKDFEVWPGDVAVFNAGRDFVPLPPFCKITWTLAGTTKSMDFTLLCYYVTFGGA